MSDTTEQPAIQAEQPSKRATLLETLQSANNLVKGLGLIMGSLLSVMGGAALVDEKVSGAAIAGSDVGQQQAAAAVEAALERAMPKAMQPVTQELSAVRTEVKILTIRLRAVETGVVLPEDATAVELPVVRPLQRQHRISRRAR